MAQIYDTLIWEYIKNPWDRGLSLDKLAKRNFNYEMISFDDLVKKQKLSDFSEVDLQTASKYSAEDVYITHELYKKQEEEKNEMINKGLKPSVDKLNKIFYWIEIPLIETLKQMELDWVKIDRDRLKELWVIFENEIIKLSNSIYEEVWEEFNISSPKQVWEILFEKLKLPRAKKTKTGWSVNAETLEALAKEHPIAKKILDYRSYSKLNSTYVIWLLDLLDENDFLHTSYNQAITATWRLSSTNPNLQNIPAWNWIAWEIRSAFVSRFKEGKIMAFDYSQVEIRLLAIMSGDENLINAFNEGFDIHSHTARLIWTTDRKIAKAVNFWIIYWISWFGLSKMIDISVKEANHYIEEFFKHYPKVREYLDNTIKFCEKNWYVETLFWRRRYIEGINDSNKMIKKRAEREAINMPIQGTSADIIKIASNKVEEFLTLPLSPALSTKGRKGENLKSKLIMQVHDELVFDVYPGEEEILEKEIKNIMENILGNTPIKLKVDVGEGKNWKEAK